MTKNSKKNRILVIGDIMVDRYISGKVLGLSYEAPVPHIEIIKTDVKIGGCGIIAENSILLGAKVNIIGIIGNDEIGKSVKNNFDKKNIGSTLFVQKGKKTITRNRIIVGTYHITRFDDPKLKLDKNTEIQIIRTLNKIIPKVKYIIISDYNKGTLTDAVRNCIREHAIKNKKQVIVSSGIDNILKYKNSDYIHKIKKNDALKLIDNEKELSDEQILVKLNDILKSTSIIMTKGSEGLVTYHNGEIDHISATYHKLRDLTSVGEILIAVFATYLAKGYSFEESCEIGNIAAGIAVDKIGIKRIEKIELEREIKQYHSFIFSK